jgi:hypothetical protein
MRLTGLVLTTYLLLVTGCSLVTNLGRFEKVEAEADAGPDADVDGPPDGDPACGDGLTFCVTMRQMGLHLRDQVYVELVTSVDQQAGQRPALIARAILDPFSRPDPVSGDGDPTAQLVMPFAIPRRGGPFDAQIWADVNANSVLDSVDHRWVRSQGLPGVFEDGVMDFVHIGNFQDLVHPPTGKGGNFRMLLQDDGAHAGMMLELHVIHPASRRTVGLYRLQNIPEATDGSPAEVNLAIDAIIEANETYDIAMYIDVNENGRYDVRADHAYFVAGLRAQQEGLLIDEEPFLLMDDPDQLVDAPFLIP